MKRRLYDNTWAVFLTLVVAGYGAVALLPEVLGTSSRAVTVPYRAVTLALALALLVLHIKRGIQAPRGIVAAILIFWTMYLTRIGADTVSSTVILRLPWYEYVAYGIGACLVPMIALMRRPTQRALLKAKKWTTGVLMVVCIIGLYRNLTSYRVEGDDIRRASEALRGIVFGHMGASLALLSLFALLIARPKRRVMVIGYLALLVLGLSVVGVSLTRSALLAVVGLGLLVFLSAFLTHGRRFVRRTAFPILAAVFVVPLTAGQFVEMNVDRMEGLRQGNPRLYAYEEAWKRFLEAPWLGSRLELATGTYPHNIVLEALMATGIVGGGLVVLILVFTIRRSLAIIRQQPTLGWVPLLFMQYTSMAMVSGAIWFQWTMWSLAGLVIAISTNIGQHRFHRRCSLDELGNRTVTRNGRNGRRSI